MTVWFTVHNNFRQNNLYQGDYKVSVEGDDISTKDTFMFHPYWQDTRIQATLDGTTSCSDTILIDVQNQWGITSNETYTKDDSS